MITITIRTDNEAFQGGNREAEIERILTEIANQIHQGRDPHVYDVNGNKVGTVVLTGRDRT